MPLIKFIAINPEGDVRDVYIKVTKNKDFAIGVQKILFYSDHAKLSHYVTEQAIFFWNEANKEVNQVATDFLHKMVEDGEEKIPTLHGMVCVTGKDKEDEKLPGSLSKDEYTELHDEIKAITGGGRRKSTHKVGFPKKQKDRFDFFLEEFLTKKKADYKTQNKKFDKKAEKACRDECAEIWSPMNDELRAPYVKMAQEDKDRFNTEMKKYKEDNPDAPKKPRAGHLLFYQDPASKLKSWKELTEKEKAPWIEAAEKDKTRYDADLVKYKEWCVKTGNDYDVMISKKRSGVTSNASSPNRDGKRAKVSISVASEGGEQSANETDDSSVEDDDDEGDDE